jgi:acetylornithine deacetylase/succinyl-diaminopimelate desuccinylase-like protein
MTRSLEAVRAAAASHVEAALERTMAICAVPSPTGAEQQRAEFVAGLLRELGYDPQIDAVSNVYARRGQRGGKVVLVLAHIDTVFPAGTEIRVSRDEQFLYGPGIGDNCSNVSGMLTSLQILDALGVETDADIVAVGTVGEEGLGNLRGARAAVERYRQDLGAVIVLDGRVGRITNTAVGSIRWRVTVSGPGGHSFGAFGTPSAIHGLGRIIAGISELSVPSNPKTTFNVGVIDGGTSVNTIAPSASMIVDMRSVDPDALATLEGQVRELIAQRPGDGLTTEIHLLGERPAGSRSQSDPLVMLAAEGCRWLGYEPEFHEASTDMNIPISLHIPAVCIGTSQGERGHTVHEHVHIAPFADGLAQITRLLVDATTWVARGDGGDWKDG